MLSSCFKASVLKIQWPMEPHYPAPGPELDPYTVCARSASCARPRMQAAHCAHTLELPCPPLASLVWVPCPACPRLAEVGAMCSAHPGLVPNGHCVQCSLGLAKVCHMC